MFRIRFHGRGGQGMKTASRILGSAFFLSGYEAQDAPRYGAERRGAPIFAYVRAARGPIQERGVIRRPDLVVVADDTLVPVPAAGVLSGLDAHTTLLIDSLVPAASWKDRLNLSGSVLILPATEGTEDRSELPFVGAVCAGAAARLVGEIPRESLAKALRQELAPLGEAIVARNLDQALAAFDSLASRQGCVRPAEEAPATSWSAPGWIDLPWENVSVSAPTIHAAATSVQSRTGLWRTLRPVVDYGRCSRCWWVCSTFCPDGAIAVAADGRPEIDYDHCKGCLICLAQCPPHAIAAVPEQGEEAGGAA